MNYSCEIPAPVGLTPATVGLFGTCGPSNWRTAFRTALKARDVPYFDPQVEHWAPEHAAMEAWHLANDQLLVFAVAEETFGFGSLAETGFPLQAVRSSSAMRFVLPYIADDVSPELHATSPSQAEASRRARILARAHLDKVGKPNVFVASSLEDLLRKALMLVNALELLESLRG